MNSLLATCTEAHITTTGGWGEQRDHVRAGSVLPWAESQKHLQSNSDVRDIIYVWGRKMSCACPMASRECSIPSPCTSPQSKGRLAWVEDVVLACLLHSKQLRGKTAPKPRNYAATLPLRVSHCLCLHRGAEKTCLFQKDFLPGCGYPQLSSCPAWQHTLWLRLQISAPHHAPSSGSALC